MQQILMEKTSSLRSDGLQRTVITDGRRKKSIELASLLEIHRNLPIQFKSNQHYFNVQVGKDMCTSINHSITPKFVRFLAGQKCDVRPEVRLHDEEGIGPSFLSVCLSGKCGDISQIGAFKYIRRVFRNHCPFNEKCQLSFLHY